MSGWVGSLCIVQQSLHVLDGCGECQRRDRSALAVKGQHVSCQTSRVRPISSSFRLSFAACDGFTVETSRAVPRRSVLLASGLGIPPMTLDLDVICIGASPSQGSPLSIASVRQLFLGDGELV
jgi:hypothetical protein